MTAYVVYRVSQISGATFCRMDRMPWIDLGF